MYAAVIEKKNIFIKSINLCREQSITVSRSFNYFAFCGAVEPRINHNFKFLHASRIREALKYKKKKKKSSAI